MEPHLWGLGGGHGAGAPGVDGLDLACNTNSTRTVSERGAKALIQLQRKTHGTMYRTPDHLTIANSDTLPCKFRGTFTE
jgi:hypothetical protein